MKYHQMRSLLIERGYEFLRQARGTHELWRHGLRGSTILVTRSGLVDKRSKQNWIQKIK